MTARKPPGVSFPDWVESQIQDAQAAGAFADLPGTGKPIPGIDSPQRELDWVAGYLRRENVEVAPLLPPALALAKEVETLPDSLSRVRSEAEARRVIEDLNARIRRAHAAPADGPPMRVKTVNAETALEQWRRAAVLAAAVEPTRPLPASPTRQRRWFGRRIQRQRSPRGSAP